jgi:dTDP-4-amino-4,6-dideoxygalactose transaminase
MPPDSKIETPIPLLDLKAQIASIRDEIDTALARVLDSGHFSLGPEVEAFERDFAAFCGVRHAVGVSSGTSALHLALLAAGIGPGNEVITVPLTFVATVAAIEYVGARPVFVDIDADSFTLDPDKLAAKITPRTKAVLPVHLFGQPADMKRINEIAHRHHLVVIEDASQAHAARYDGRRTGSLGHLGCFSFYPTKNLGAYGESGAVVTNDDELARRLRMLRDWGQEGKYNHVVRGYNYRMEAFQGAILQVKLRHLDDWTAARRGRAKRYGELLRGLPVDLPRELPRREHAYHIYALRVRRRAQLQQRLAAGGVTTAVHYPEPVHRILPYRDLGYAEGAFPVSEQVAKEQLSLPLFPELTDAQQQRVVTVLKEALGEL